MHPYIYRGNCFRQKILSLNTDILNIVSGEKKKKSLKSKKAEITVSLSFGPVMPESSVEKRRTQ